MFLLLWLGDPSQIRMTDMNAMSLAFVSLYILGTGVRNISGGIVIPMIPDVADYEVYKNDRYAPGVMGTIFSFVDKMISSLGQTVIGLLLAFIGFKEVFPSVDTPATSQIFWVTMILFIGLLILGWIASLIAMKFYELDDKRMAEIQMELADRRDAKKAAIEQ
jgi:Na+/melibiose symporter-like transporter